VSRCRKPVKDGVPMDDLQCCRVSEHDGDCCLHSPLMLLRNWRRPHTFHSNGATYHALVCTRGRELDGESTG
jgi:hypothetical protein